jgi:hypothetical protein
MRQIEIPRTVIELATSTRPQGRNVAVAVKLDWPELQLTELERVANALAIARGERPRFPDRSIVQVLIPVVVPR